MGASEVQASKPRVKKKRHWGVAMRYAGDAASTKWDCGSLASVLPNVPLWHKEYFELVTGIGEADNRMDGSLL